MVEILVSPFHEVGVAEAMPGLVGLPTVVHGHKRELPSAIKSGDEAFGRIRPITGLYMHT